MLIADAVYYCRRNGVVCLSDMYWSRPCAQQKRPAKTDGPIGMPSGGRRVGAHTLDESAREIVKLVNWNNPTYLTVHYKAPTRILSTDFFLKISSNLRFNSSLPRLCVYIRFYHFSF